MRRSTAAVVVCENMLVSENIYETMGEPGKGVSWGDLEIERELKEKNGAVPSKKLVEEEKEKRRKLARATQRLSPFYTSCDDATLQWSFHTEEQVAMLDMLFKWLAEQGSVSSKKGVVGKRSLTVFCAGGQGGVETVVVDRSTGNSFKQVCVGTMGDVCRPFDLPKKGVVAGSGDKCVVEGREGRGERGGVLGEKHCECVWR